MLYEQATQVPLHHQQELVVVDLPLVHLGRLQPHPNDQSQQTQSRNYNSS